MKKTELQALSVHSELNDKKQKPYSLLDKNNKTYLLLDPKNIDLAFLDAKIKEFAARFSGEVEVDLNSFADLYASASEKEINALLGVCVTALKFCQKAPFSMKKDGTKNKYELKFLSDAKFKEGLQEAAVLSSAISFCRRLQDTPSNLLDAEKFVEEVLDFFGDLKSKVNVRVLDKKALAANNMNLLLGVNKGSVKEPRLICIEYLNNPDSKEKYGYIGKGIIFDSGGMNIKTGSYMRHMKFDMSGAAIVMSTVYALAKNNIKANVVAVGAMTDNMPGATAQRPDDIIVSHSGKTVEIDNTDAEGRLVLADALSYAAVEYGVTKLVDVATLTGAIKICLGDTYTGAWATNDQDWKVFNKSAELAGEYVWRLPFHEDYLRLLDSKVADIANSVSDMRAGSSRAACFLREFTHNKDFIHLDVAATADARNMGQGTMIKTLYNFAKTQK